MAASFAMVLDIPFEEFVATVGHDGSDIAFPGLPEPMQRRGFHIQECIRVCLHHGYAVTPVELFPAVASTPLQGVPTKVVPVTFGTSDDHWSRFTRLIHTTRGVIDGVGRRCGHAVAYSHGQIYDPDGHEYGYSREACESRFFISRCLWRVDRIHQ